MMQTAPHQTPARPLVPIRAWARDRSIPASTALEWAREGRLNGTDADHPIAQRDDRGRWLVAPDAYIRSVEVEPAPDVALERLIDRRIAKVLRAALAELDGMRRDGHV